MLQVIMLLLFFWLIITVLGHLSWMILSALLGLLFSPTKPDEPKLPSGDNFEITRRMLRRLVNEKRLREDAAAIVFRALRKLSDETKKDSAAPVAARQTDVSTHPVSERQQSTAGIDQPNALLQGEPVSGEDQLVKDATSKEAEETGIATSDDSGIIDASLITHVDKSSGRLKPDAAPARLEEMDSARSAPVLDNVSKERDSQKTLSPALSHSASVDEGPSPLSRSEIIQSFLSAHNIRWGELVAGILIVVCSIGLVRTLWSPLIATHRVLPSLIFLAANAAIYSAGLYTLSRWRLRHTSRAILVIATLLVPLSVLAGIAAATKHPSGVLLSEPITMIAIAVATSVYGWFTYRGSKALAHRLYALPLVIAVAGPVMLLPFIRILIAKYDSNAGWFMLLGSLSLYTATELLIRSGRKREKIGQVVTRIYLYLLGFGFYSFSIALGYFALSVRGENASAYLPMTLAAMPGMLSLCAVAWEIRHRALQATKSLFGMNAAAVLLGISFVVLIPCGVSVGWIWSWGALFSGSAILISYRLRQPQWCALASVPIGISVVMNSKVWMGLAETVEASLWLRVINGEAFFSSFLVCGAVAVWLLLDRQSKRGTWLKFSLIGWGVYTMCVATTLVFLPVSRLGDFPQWLLSALIFVVTLVSVYGGVTIPKGSLASVVSVFLFWLSIWKPSNWFAETAIEPLTWSVLLSGVSLLTISEFLPTLCRNRQGAREFQPGMLQRILVQATDFSVCFVAASSIFLSLDHLSLLKVVGSLLAVTILMLWSAMQSSSLLRLAFSQILSVVFTVCSLRYLISEDLIPAEWWSNEFLVSGQSFWLIAIASILFAAIWLSLRIVAALAFAHSQKRLKHEDSEGDTSPNLSPSRWRLWIQEDASWGKLPDSWVTLSIPIWCFASLLISISNNLLHLDEIVDPGARLPFFIPAIAIAGMISLNGLIINWANLSTGARDYFLATIVLASLWFGFSVPSVIFGIEGVREDLVLAISTSVVVAALFRIGLFRGALSIWRATYDQSAGLLFGTLIILFSLRFLATDWLQPYLNGDAPLRLTCIAVVVWLIIGSAFLLSSSASKFRFIGLTLSCILFVSAGVIALPLAMTASPFQLVQVGCVSIFMWNAMAFLLFSAQERQRLKLIRAMACSIASVCGVLTSLVATWMVVANSPSFGTCAWTGGYILSVLSSLAISRNQLCIKLLGSASQNVLSSCSWPVCVSLLAGQLIGCLDYLLDLDALQAIKVVCACWVITSLATLWTFYQKQSVYDIIHLVGVAVITSGIAVMVSRVDPLLTGLAMTAVVTCGFMAPILNLGTVDQRYGIVGRFLGWLTLLVGTLVISDIYLTRMDLIGRVKVYVVWGSVWLLIWNRIADKLSRQTQGFLRRLPELEIAFSISIVSCCEFFSGLLQDQGSSFAGDRGDPFFYLRILCYLVASYGLLIHSIQKWHYCVSFLNLAAISALIANVFASGWSPTVDQRMVIASLAVSIVFAVCSYLCFHLAVFLGKRTGSQADCLRTLVDSIVLNVQWLTFGTFAIAVSMMIKGTPVPQIHLMITTIAVSAWTYAQLGDLSNRDNLRHFAVRTALVAVGSWVSVNLGSPEYAFLIASMRWLVVSLLLLLTLLFIAPWLLSKGAASRWNPALRQGSQITGGVSLVALASMLVSEIMLRTENGIAGVPTVQVIAVGIIVGLLAILAAIISFLTGPRYALRQLIPLSDQHREWLIYSAQALGAMAWLHFYLCRPDWVYVELREKWCYFVMLLAFVSVGVTELARRIDDTVLMKVFKRTAFLLPFIPLLGFWISSRGNASFFSIEGSGIRYEVLLLIGAIYYAMVSYLWKTAATRIITILLGNAAWWFLLVQSPGWSFIEHPQLWLIPPAFCALFMVSLYRDKLEAETSTGIRYCAMLAIYLSSTADMLIQQIGTNIWGPIILILLSLFGMLSGIVLRVRAFLFLGAAFVFLGTASMVWHANRFMESVWPWWVFGITTGICLLAALMALEKYKPQLKRYSAELSKWDK